MILESIMCVKSGKVIAVLDFRGSRSQIYVCRHLRGTKQRRMRYLRCQGILHTVQSGGLENVQEAMWGLKYFQSQIFKNHE